MIKVLVGVQMIGLAEFGLLMTAFFGPVALASDATVATENVPANVETIRAPSRVDRMRARAADPWFTRGTVTMFAGMTAWSASMPTDATATQQEGEANGGGIALDLYGRRIAFHMALSGAASRNLAEPVAGAGPARFTAGEARVAFGTALWNSQGIYLGVGPGLEARASGYGSFDEGNEFFTSWQTVTAGADVRARFFVGPRVIFTTSAFAGVLPISGTWQRVDAAATTTEIMMRGQMSNPVVFSGTASASLRPAEWIAFEGGVAARHASWKLDGHQATERSLRPFVGLALLY